MRSGWKSSKKSDAVSSFPGKSHCIVTCSTQLGITQLHTNEPTIFIHVPTNEQLYTSCIWTLSCTKLLYLEINTPIKEQKETTQNLSGHLRLYIGGSQITEKAVWSIVPVLVVDWAFSFQMQLLCPILCLGKERKLNGTVKQHPPTHNKTGIVRIVWCTPI